MNPALFVDTHCHLDAYFRPSEPAEAAARAGVQVIAVTNLPSARQRLKARLPSAAHVRIALGAHPSEASKMHDGEWRILKAHVAGAEDIGEIGLDFSPGADRAVQERVFSRVLSMVCDRPRFISVHSRRAVRQVLKHLAQAHVRAAVLHWFSGTPSELDAALDAGHVLSVNTSMIATAKGRNLIQEMPRDRVLAESDGPFARHHGRPAEPSDVLEVYMMLARCWKVEICDVRAQLARNLEAVRVGIVTRAPSLF